MNNWMYFPGKKITWINVDIFKDFIFYCIITEDGKFYQDSYDRRFGIYNPFKCKNVRDFMKNATCTRKGSRVNFR